MSLQRQDWIFLGVPALLSVVAFALLLHGLTSAPLMPDALVVPDTKIAAGPPPKAEPLIFAPVAAAEARRLNDAISFAGNRGPAPRPFALAGDSESQERAIDCLASAMWYEAGESESGQRAVAQVVLNRVRHPAYPGTICGVVFQGAERRSGCQFTFTCDGAMRRIPPQTAFARAQKRARDMLQGAVWKDVGLATHYHTNWVHPVWSARLDKIAQVDTHLFFRWHGGWGGPQAQRRRYQGGEPLTAKLAAVSSFHRPPLATADNAVLPKGHGRSLAGAPQELGEGRFQVSMTTGRNGNVQAMAAHDLCGNRDFCKVTGRLAEGGVAFLYVRDKAAGVEKVLWDCDSFKRPTPAQCFTGSNRSWLTYTAQATGKRAAAANDGGVLPGDHGLSVSGPAPLQARVSPG